MKVITAMEWRKVLDVLEYVKQHVDEGECQDCFSYDMEGAVNEAIEILSALEDKPIEEVQDELEAEQTKEEAKQLTLDIIKGLADHDE